MIFSGEMISILGKPDRFRNGQAQREKAARAKRVPFVQTPKSAAGCQSLGGSTLLEEKLFEEGELSPFDSVGQSWLIAGRSPTSFW